MRRLLMLAALGAVAATACLSSAIAPVAGAAPPAMRSIGSAPRLPAGASVVGALPDSTPMTIAVALEPRDPAALASYATAVSTPGASAYRRYLTVAEFRQRFAPTTAQIAAIDAALRTQGLTPTAVSSNGLLIQVSATAGELSRAFSGSFEQVRLRSGRTAFTDTQAPRLEASVAGLVQGVIGLDNLTEPRPLLAHPQARTASGPLARSAHAAGRGHLLPRVVTGGPQPCAAASAAAAASSAYTADEQAAMYDFQGLYGAGDKGAGVTVALFELEPNIPSDISAYASCYSGVSATVNYIAEDGGPTGSAPGPGKTYNGLETELDIENVIGLAPAATIDVYQAPNTNTGLIDNYTAMVDNSSVNVISTSWGLCEADSGSSIIGAEGTLFEQAATEGKSVFAAAGDSGSDDCGTGQLAVDDPASQPYVTGVGGTSAPTDSASSQTVWNDGSPSGAGGGGISNSHTMPTYQSAAPSALNVVNANSSGSSCGAPAGGYCREVPDVSASADENHGYVVYYDGGWTSVGGTSGAAPLWAALTALTDASSACADTPIGFANPALYEAATSSYTSDFFDVTSGNNAYDGTTLYSLYPAGTGYDMASGLGTPNATNLATALCGYARAAKTVTVTDPGDQTGTVGTAVSLQIQASDSAFGQPLTYSATGLPAGLSISSATGKITGTPTSQGTSSVTVTATDGTGAHGSTSFTWTINPVANTVTVASPGNHTGTVGTAVSLQIAATDSGSGQTLTYTATGLPAGLSISSATGRITGTPTTQGSSSVTVTATDGTGAHGSTSFTWTINPATATIATTTSLSSSKNPSLTGQTVTYTAVVSDGDGVTPVGAVSFRDNGKQIRRCGSVALVQGVAHCSVTYSNVGGSPHTIIASYGGDSSDDLGSSTSAPLSQVVRRASTKLIAVRATRRSHRVAFSATLTRSFDHARLAGERVAFSVGGRQICKAKTNRFGTARCTVVASSAAPARYRARFSGSADYLASSAVGHRAKSRHRRRT